MRFRITDSCGFHIVFENGWTISVRFGPGNYCDNHAMEIGKDEQCAGKRGSSTAECAIRQTDGELSPHPSFRGGNTVGGYLTPAQVLDLMNWTAQQPRES